MSFKVTRDAFRTEEDARRQARERGFDFFKDNLVAPVAQAPGKEKPHYHDFDALTFVVEGLLDFTDLETGERYNCGPGTLVEDVGRNAHFESHAGFRALSAYRVDPETLVHPLVRPA